ncbi:MAG: hypothetical protein H5U04_07465 [Firmicutes bacterium]|nr:hypothetical protein [Bacillota bacterium]
MPETRAQADAAAAGEPVRRFASEEFFFLLQRIDRLDEKLTARIDGVDEKLMARIDAVTARIDTVDAKLTARIDGVEARLLARIDTVDVKIEKLRDQVDGLRYWIIGLVATMLLGFGGMIVTMLMRG